MGTRILSVLNALIYLFTRFHLLEGRYARWLRRYHNWDSSFSAKPKRFLYPTREQDICDAVRNGQRIGVVGAGHSFNGMHLDRDTLISLDRYTKRVRYNLNEGTVVFQAGARLRDVAVRLKKLDLALPVLPDHNAQSLAGLLATDVHASGKPDGPAHVSEAVNYIRLIDGNGVPRDAYPGDPLFRATIGGMGCTGIIVEVGLKCGPPFRVKTEARRYCFPKLLQDLESLRANNDLVAAGYFPYIDACVVETKNRTSDPLTLFGPLRETMRHVSQAVAQTLFLPLARSRFRILRAASTFMLDQATKRLREHTPLVLDNFEGFNRNVYQVHSEAEFTVPLTQAKAALQEGYDLIRAQPFSAHYLLGIRMSRANEQTLIGPASGGPQDQIAWIAPHLDGNKRDKDDDARWRQLCERYDGRPHMGKHLLGLDETYLAKVHGANWNDFLTTIRQSDPEQKFANALTRSPLRTSQRPSSPPAGSPLGVFPSSAPTPVPVHPIAPVLTDGLLLARGLRDEADHGN